MIRLGLGVVCSPREREQMRQARDERAVNATVVEVVSLDHGRGRGLGGAGMHPPATGMA